MRSRLLALWSMLALVAVLAIPLSTTYAAPKIAGKALASSRYTFAVFTNSSESRMYIYQSTDGLNFSLLAGPTYTPPTGLLRDPSIIRNTADGLYYITYTTNWAGNTIGLASSPDRIHWTFIENITMPAGTFVTWAPEWFRDSNGSMHIIVNLNRTNTGDSNFNPYDLTSLHSNLRSWSAPVALAGVGPNYIDSFIVKVGSVYHIFAKNETTKYIEHATATNLNGPYTFVGRGNWAGWGQYLEGPALYQLDNGNWRIVIDGYNSKHYYYSDSSNTFKTWTAKAILPDGLSGFVRHGTVLKETV
jgi:sucrose-6-phosphate hydrolase SacC (GH32 family)